MSNYGNYYYNAMPFSLKNASATYQRIMDAFFALQIRQSLEVYISDMTIKIEE